MTEWTDEQMNKKTYFYVVKNWQNTSIISWYRNWQNAEFLGVIWDYIGFDFMDSWFNHMDDPIHPNLVGVGVNLDNKKHFFIQKQLNLHDRVVGGYYRFIRWIGLVKCIIN